MEGFENFRPVGTIWIQRRFYELLRGSRGSSRLKFVVEILKLKRDQPPEVLHRFAHSATSIHMIRETMKAVLKSPQWPSEAQGFRIMTDDGSELYRWPEPVGL